MRAIVDQNGQSCRTKLDAATSEVAGLHKQLEAEKRDVDRLRALTMKGDATVQELLDQLQVFRSPRPFGRQKRG